MSKAAMSWRSSESIVRRRTRSTSSCCPRGARSRTSFGPRSRGRARRAEVVGWGPAAVLLGVVDALVEPEAMLAGELEVAGELAALQRAAHPRVKDQLRGAAMAELTRIAGDDPMHREWMGEED